MNKNYNSLIWGRNTELKSDLRKSDASHSDSKSSVKTLSWMTLILMLMASFNLSAQVNYSRTVLSGQTYSTLSGAGITTINNVAGLTAGVMSVNQDDGAVIITLPFTWTYNGNTFT